eukprot:scaffold837_cov416-Prasinococcus_capsulatus_cf.AAC.6
MRSLKNGPPTPAPPPTQYIVTSMKLQLAPSQHFYQSILPHSDGPQPQESCTVNGPDAQP